MKRFLQSLTLGLLIGMWMSTSGAEEIAAKAMAKEPVTREQINALDQQIQDVKSDVLDISHQLIQLEEKLIYPPNAQLTIFLSVASGDKFRLDAVKIKIDGKASASYIYTAKELDALQHGGVQRIFTGSVRSGEHVLDVTIIGKSAGNDDYQKNAAYKFTKDMSSKLIEINVAGPGSGNQGINFRD